MLRTQDGDGKAGRDDHLSKPSILGGINRLRAYDCIPVTQVLLSDKWITRKYDFAISLLANLRVCVFTHGGPAPFNPPPPPSQSTSP